MTATTPWCVRMRRFRRICCTLAFLCFASGVLRAQDPFEIHVLEYEDLGLGEFTFETHLNYVGQGTSTFDGTIAPTHDQFRATYELTGGITSFASLGVMQLNAKLPGGSLQAAGWRVVPHFYAPRRWHWPIDAGLVLEFAFEKSAWSVDPETVEIVPVLEKHFGRAEVDLNPAIGRALHGPDTRRGWSFEPALRFGYRMTPRVTPSIEYYGAWGSLPAFQPVASQTHELIPGADIRLARGLLWNLGVGFGLTPTGDRVIYKSRLEFSFGRRSRDQDAF